MTRWLVTGATGLIGAPVVARLASMDSEVHACARRADHDVGPITWHQADLLDRQQATELIRRVRPTHLLHLAWETTPGAYRGSPLNTDWLDASTSLIRSFGESGGERFVGVGVGEEYLARTEPCDESGPLAPGSEYAKAKVALSNELASQSGALGFSSAWCRVFQAYGPREHKVRLIPSAVRSLLRGEVFECSAGTQIRDFIHTDDIAGALIHVTAGPMEGAVNVASGTGATVRSVIERLAGAIGRPDLLRFGARPMDPDEPQVLVADTQRLRSSGWAPIFDLDAGLKATMAAWT